MQILLCSWWNKNSFLLFHPAKIPTPWCLFLLKKFAFQSSTSLDFTKYSRLYLIYILDIFLSSFCHITKYAAFARIIHIDFNHRYGRSKSFHSQPLELFHKQFYRQIDSYLFTYRSIQVWKVLFFRTIYQIQLFEFVYMDTILDFMVSNHLAESRPIIAPLYVWLIYYCSKKNLCFQIIIWAQSQPDIAVQ